MLKDKVIVGVSGGVDSSVAIKLLKDQGYEVEGMFMRNWDSLLNNDIKGNPNDLFDVCPQEKDYMDAKEVCEKLDVKLHRVDFVKEYWDNVFSYFLNEYKKGRTPNPDVMCNKYIKFDCFKKYALDLGAKYISMGHFAIGKWIDNRFHLYKAKDLNKDQTYFLCLTKYEQLKDTLFPIGDYTKAEVREIASSLGLSTATKKDSTGICFIGERHFNEFLSNYLPSKQGKIVSVNGEVVGTHNGLMYYTIGQRKGIGIGGLKDHEKLPWFVCGKNLDKNELIVAQGDDEELLYSNNCYIENVNIINELESKDLYGKFRYRSEDVKIHVEDINEDRWKITYDHVKSVTPGQILAFYSESGECLGGGIISEVYMDDVKRQY